MKVLQVCPYDFNRPGGVKTHIVGLSDALTKKGHDVKIVVPRQSTSEQYDLRVYPFGRNMGLAFGGTH
ncbi:MAG: glycosyltransferase family 4 protein, partial [Cytophagales bacterium]|nr:glycosyltransferase family 4 protein [Cytophagales bacterium]